MVSVHVKLRVALYHHYKRNLRLKYIVKLVIYEHIPIVNTIIEVIIIY